MPNLVFFQDCGIKEFLKRTEMVGIWETNHCSTLTFLTFLNFSVGRSFHTKRNYPIFPWPERIQNSLSEKEDKPKVSELFHSFEPFKNMSDHLITLSEATSAGAAPQEVFCAPDLLPEGELREDKYYASNNYRKALEAIPHKTIMDWVKINFEIDISKFTNEIPTGDMWQRFISQPYSPLEVETVIAGDVAMFMPSVTTGAPTKRSSFQVAVKSHRNSIAIPIDKNNIQYVTIDNEGNGIRVLVISNNTFSAYSLDLQSSKASQISVSESQIDLSNQPVLFTASHDSIVALSGSKITVCSVEIVKEMIIKMGEIDQMNASDNIILTYTHDGDLKMWKYANFAVPFSIVKIFNDSVFAASIEYNIGLVSVLTNDGFILFYNLNKSRFLNSFEIGPMFDKSKVLLITPGEGFTLLFSDFHMWIFSANGFLIKDCDVGFKIQAIIAWSDMSGIDHVTIQNQSNEIITFEAIHPEETSLMCSELPHIIHMSYIQKKHAIFAITSEMNVEIIPEM